MPPELKAKLTLALKQLDIELFKEKPEEIKKKMRLKETFLTQRAATSSA